MIGWLSGLSLLIQPSCGPDEPRLAPLTSPISRQDNAATVTITALPRDIRPAVMRALPLVEFAPLNETGSYAEGFLDYELVGLRSEPGRARVEFQPTDGTLKTLREPRPMTIKVTLGRFGDPDRERDLARRIAREAITLGEAAE